MSWFDAGRYAVLINDYTMYVIDASDIDDAKSQASTHYMTLPGSASNPVWSIEARKVDHDLT